MDGCQCQMYKQTIKAVECYCSPFWVSNKYLKHGLNTANDNSINLGWIRKDKKYNEMGILRCLELDA